MKRLVVLASGSGSNFENIVTASHQGEINAEVVELIVSSSKAFAIERARRLKISYQVIREPKATYNAVLKAKPDVVVLAGYLKKLSDEFVQKYTNKILNIHPSLLPKFGGHGMYGDHVFKSVLAAKEQRSGATVHWVNENFDEGPIYAQDSFLIEPEETLETLKIKTAAIEKNLYIRVLKEVCAQ